MVSEERRGEWLLAVVFCGFEVWLSVVVVVVLVLSIFLGRYRQAIEDRQAGGRRTGGPSFQVPPRPTPTNSTSIHPLRRHLSFLQHHTPPSPFHIWAIVESSSYRYPTQITPAAKMANPEVHHLFHNPIADHSFSADRTTLAVARDSNVELYSKVGNAFKLKDELRSHDKTVTSVDIAPNSGRIVSCSQGLSLFFQP